MRNRRLLWGAVILFVVCLAACKKEKPQSPIPDSLASLQELFNPAYQIDADSIRLMIRSYLNENPVTPGIRLCWLIIGKRMNSSG